MSALVSLRNANGYWRTSCRCLFLDDWGLAPLTPEQERDLLEILDDRHGCSSNHVGNRTHARKAAVIGRLRLFTRYFLIEGICGTDASTSIDDAAVAFVRARLHALLTSFGKIKNPTEAETEKEPIWPVLEAMSRYSVGFSFD
jgi:hypothetical protein